MFPFCGNICISVEKKGGLRSKNIDLCSCRRGKIRFWGHSAAWQNKGQGATPYSITYVLGAIVMAICHLPFRNRPAWVFNLECHISWICKWQQESLSTVCIKLFDKGGKSDFMKLITISTTFKSSCRDRTGVLFYFICGTFLTGSFIPPYLLN